MMKRLLRLASALLALALTACTLGGPTPTVRLVQPPDAPTSQVAIITPGATQIGVPPATAVPGTLPPGATITPRAPTGPTMTTAPGVPTVAANPAIKATKLTGDGCCPRPQWLADSSGVIFYGTPLASDPRRGTWAIGREGGTPRFYSAAFGTFSPDRSLIATPDGDLARIVRPDGTTVGGIINGGKRAYLAATNDRVAWMVPATGVGIVSTSLDPPFQVTIARPDGGGIVTLPPVFTAETIQWFPDGRRILINGRDSRAEHPGLWVLDTNTGAATQIFTSSWLENVAISPDGTRIAYTATLQADKSLDGIWLIGADGSGRQKLTLTGGYRWTPDSRALLYLPTPTGRPGDELWRYTLADGARAPLVNGEQVPFAVAQDEWEVAPDGTAIAYRSATDGAIWTLRFAR
jgi:hypothetical protein